MSFNQVVSKKYQKYNPFYFKINLYFVMSHVLLLKFEFAEFYATAPKNPRI